MKQLEKMRAEIRATEKRGLKIGAGIGAGVGMLMMAGGAWQNLDGEGIAFVISMIVGILVPMFFGVMIAWIFTISRTASKRKEFYERYKKECVEKLLKKIFRKVKYYHNAGLAPEMIRGTGMMTTGDRYRSNDFVLGEYKDVKFAQSDVHIERRWRDSDGDVHYATIFRGRWMVFEFRRNFRSEVQIISKGFSGALVGSGREEIEMEDAEFNRMFKVLANDGMEAFYILTPDMMEKIKLLVKEIGAEVMFCFKDKAMCVAVNDHRDSFEPDLRKKTKVDEMVARTKKEIKLITDVVDGLEIDERIFKIG